LVEKADGKVDNLINNKQLNQGLKEALTNILPKDSPLLKNLHTFDGMAKAIGAVD
jgi:hypothetical protein